MSRIDAQSSATRDLSLLSERDRSSLLITGNFEPLGLNHIDLLSQEDQEALLKADSQCNAEAFSDKRITVEQFMKAFDERDRLLRKLGTEISQAMDRGEIPIPQIAPEDVAVGYGACDGN